MRTDTKTDKMIQLQAIKPIEKFGKFIGRSRQMQKVYKQIRQAATVDIPILLTGETGTGKDLAAQAIHNLSVRQEQPFLPVNLGAIPSELIGSELFGHTKGSFTGAINTYQGKFEQADKGVIFLDEIDAIDPKTQVSLLRLIEKQHFFKIGDTRECKTNTRIITATNKDLTGLIDQGLFREDLYYRLDVFRIDMPPLREHPEDIPYLVGEILEIYNQAFEKHIHGISEECLKHLQNYPWPGNVRELKNVIQRAALMCFADVLDEEHLPDKLVERETLPEELSFKMGTPLADIQKEVIIKTLEFTNNNRKRTAEILGISRHALYNNLAKYDAV